MDKIKKDILFRLLDQMTSEQSMTKRSLLANEVKELINGTEKKQIELFLISK